MINIQHLERDLSLVRDKSPLIHNITNYVVMNNTANALLSIGASPVMAHSVDEVVEMTGIASAAIALMNVGRHKCRHWKLTVQTMNAGLHCFGKTRRFQLLLMKVHFQAVMHGLTHWRMRDYFAPL